MAGDGARQPPAEGGIDVVRVPHGARDVDAPFGEAP